MCVGDKNSCDELDGNSACEQVHDQDTRCDGHDASIAVKVTALCKTQFAGDAFEMGGTTLVDTTGPEEVVPKRRLFLGVCVNEQNEILRLRVNLQKCTEDVAESQSLCHDEQSVLCNEFSDDFFLEGER